MFSEYIYKSSNTSASVSTSDPLLDFKIKLSQLQRVKDTTNGGHIYMIQEREFVNAQLPIYKIGKSTRIVHRMPSYPKDSRVYSIMYTGYNVHRIESMIIDYFDALFVNRTDIGREYYQCNNALEMIRSLSLLFPLITSV